MSPTLPEGQEPGHATPESGAPVSGNSSAAGAASVAGPDTIGLLMEMEMPLLVRFGSTRMLVNDILALGTGSVVEFRRGPDDPVDLVVNGRVVARALVVQVQGNYGVRITEIASQREELVTSSHPAARPVRGDQ